MYRSYGYSARLVSLIAALFGFFVNGLSYADSLHVTDDTFTNPNSTIVKGGSLDVLVRDAAGERRGYAKFDMSTLASSTVAADVDSATLRFWVKNVITGGTIDLYLVNGAWDEQTLTASIAPAIGATPFASVSVLPGDEGSFVSADVTAAVISWLSANNGLAMVASGGARIDIDSKETDSDPAEIEQTSSAMQIEVALIGPEGPAGADGAQGPQGVAGNDGADGLQGVQGIPGNDGADGADGAQGMQGVPGLQGIQGDPGPQGVAGNDGADGAEGPPGPQGPPGLPGNVVYPAVCPHGDSIAYDSNFSIWVCSSQVSTNPPIYAIGDPGPAGGIVFYVTDGGTHGLEISPDGLGPFQVGVGWGCPGTYLPGTGNEQIGSGPENTRWILAGCNHAGIPARRADEYSLNGFDDWFLPSNLELFEYYLQQNSLPPLGGSLFWTSTQINANSARTVDWLNGSAYGFIAKRTVSISPFGTIRARAVRAF